MSTSHLTDADSATAQTLWQDYQAQHDLSDQVGRSVGIDPASGRIWFGESIRDIVRQMDDQQAAVPLYFVRVGADSYWRKGGHR